MQSSLTIPDGDIHVLSVISDIPNSVLTVLPQQAGVSFFKDLQFHLAKFRRKKQCAVHY